MSAPLSQEKAAALLRAVGGVLAEFGATGPDVVIEAGDVEAPASYLLDHLYRCWNDCLNEIHEISAASSGSWEPDPLDPLPLPEGILDSNSKSENK